MKKRVRIICLSLIVCMLAQLLPFHEMTVEAKTDQKKETVIPIGQEMDNTTVAVDVTVEQEGAYTVDVVYHATEATIADVQIGVSVNDEPMKMIEIPKYWTTEEDYRIDGAGNEFAAKPVLVTEDMKHTIMQYADFAYQEFCITLKSGVNQIKLTAPDEKVYLEKLIVTKQSQVGTYSEQDVQDKIQYVLY